MAVGKSEANFKRVTGEESVVGRLVKREESTCKGRFRRNKDADERKKKNNMSKKGKGWPREMKCKRKREKEVGGLRYLPV